MSLQFDSRPLSQNRPSCSVTTTQNSSEYENRNGTGYTLQMLHNRKSQRCIRWLFLMNTRAGTVLTFRGNGTGSWRHNRVAGAGIAPAPGGYEPPDLLLVYPAIRDTIPFSGCLTRPRYIAWNSSNTFRYLATVR